MDWKSIVRGDFRFEERHIRRFQPAFTLVAAHAADTRDNNSENRFARESQSEDFQGSHLVRSVMMIRLVIV